MSTRVTLSSGEEPCRLMSHSHSGRSRVDSRHTLIWGGTVSTHVTLSSGEEPCRLMHTCIFDNEGSECLVAPQLPLALCGDQPGHTECSCVNFTGGHKHMVHTVISIVSALACGVCVYMHTDTQLYYSGTSEIRAVYSHWTGLVDWTSGLDWWTDTKNHFYAF